MVISSSAVKYEKRDRIAFVTLNRPEVLNALNQELFGALSEALQDATKDDDILVVIVTGEGGRAFSAGADLKEMANRDAQGPTQGSTQPAAPRGMSGFDAILNCPKPIIAAIDGYCVAGGLEVSLYCDIRIATEKSRFGLPEPRRSLLAGPGLHNLSRMIPLGEALWIQLTGAHMTAQRAYDIGLIQALVPDRDALFAEAERVANEIKQCAPLAVQAIKRIAKTGRNLPLEESWKMAAPIQEQINKTEDRLEGPKAFAEGRAPVWKMR